MDTPNPHISYQDPTMAAGNVRSVLIEVEGSRLLLPNATLAEVLSYSDPEVNENNAPWLLGHFRWRGWRLPLVAFSRLANIGWEMPGLGSKVLVLKALGEHRALPYFALLTPSFPRLVTISRDSLRTDESVSILPDFVQAQVLLNDEPVLLPDLMQIEQALLEQRNGS